MITRTLVAPDCRTLVAVDPSIVSPGAAFFWDGKLQSAEQFAARKLADLPTLERAVEVSQIVMAWLVRVVPVIPQVEGIDALVVECPQHDGRTRRVRPEDIIKLSAAAGAVATRIAASKVISVTPSEWCGSVEKSRSRPWDSPRGHLIWSCLHETERDVASGTGPDAMDAIGIGLAVLGRLVPRRRRTRPGDPGILTRSKR